MFYDEKEERHTKPYKGTVRCRNDKDVAITHENQIATIRRNITNSDDTVSIPITEADQFIDITESTITLNNKQLWGSFIECLNEHKLKKVRHYNNFSRSYEITYDLPVIENTIISKNDVTRNSAKINLSQSNWFAYMGKMYDPTKLYNMVGELPNVVFDELCDLYIANKMKEIKFPNQKIKVMSMKYELDDVIDLRSYQNLTHIDLYGPSIEYYYFSGYKCEKRQLTESRKQPYREKYDYSKSHIAVITKNLQNIPFVRKFKLSYKDTQGNWVLLSECIGINNPFSNNTIDLAPYGNSKIGLYCRFIKIEPTELHVDPQGIYHGNNAPRNYRINVYGITNEVTIEQKEIETVSYIIEDTSTKKFTHDGIVQSDIKYNLHGQTKCHAKQQNTLDNSGDDDDIDDDIISPDLEKYIYSKN